MWPSLSSSSCASRRRVGRAESDRSRGGIRPILVWGVVGVSGGCGCLWCCTWEGWVFAGWGAGFCWNYGLFWRVSCVVVGLPCAVRGVCAHGSSTAAVTGIAVPHDFAVPTDVGCTRVCNTHHPWQAQALAEPARGCPVRLIRLPAPRITPPGTITPEARTLSQMF